MAKKKRKLATLTAKQSHRYAQLFNIAWDGTARGERSADREAWKGLCEEWPALRAFDGARA